MLTRVLAVIILLASFSATTAVAQEWSAEQQEVWGEIMKGWDAWFSTDVDASYEYVHPDFVFWNSNNSTPGGREIGYTLDTAFFSAVGTKWHGPTVQPLTILVEGDIAIIHAYFRGFEESAGEAPKWSTVRVMEVRKKVGDKWMLLANYVDPE